MLYIPEFNGSVVHYILAAFLISAPVLFWGEATGYTSLGYSKFAKQSKPRGLPSRLGMLIIYFPAILLYWLALSFADFEPAGWHVLIGALVSAHFGKRCLEVLFVHSYSGVMNLGSVLTICALYSAESFLLGYVAATEVTPALLGSGEFQPMLRTGLAIWGLGTALNFFHHRVLAQLRAPGETGYKMPKRGLFRWVACPHYLAELIAWWGFALVFWHVGAAIMAVVMTCYLAGRAHNTVSWYRERLGDEVPANWRRLIPFVY